MKRVLEKEPQVAPVSQFAAIRAFIDRNFQHFNAAVVKDACRAYEQLLAGKGKIHAISTTGANLEEDIFNLVAHNFYERVPDYRLLSKEDEEKLLNRHLNR